MAKGASRLSNVLIADDSAVMLDGLRLLQLPLDIDGTTIRIHSDAGALSLIDAVDLFCGNSGTTIRFLTAMCAAGQGTFTLDGVPRMRQRPIRGLAELLEPLGATIDYLGEPGFPPVRLHAAGLRGGTVHAGSAVSSQFLSALLMAAPMAAAPVTVVFDGPQTSWPYVKMTLAMMSQFGVAAVVTKDPNTGEPATIDVPNTGYRGTDYDVEPDASNAAYFWAAAAISSGSSVTTHGLGRKSLQGDVGVADLLRRDGRGGHDRRRRRHGRRHGRAARHRRRPDRHAGPGADAGGGRVFCRRADHAPRPAHAAG